MIDVPLHESSAGIIFVQPSPLAMAAVVYNNTTALLAPKFGWSSFFSSGNMPSIRNIAFSALGGAQSVLGLWNSVARDTSFGFGASETCTNPQLSCHNTSAVENLCCFNYPGGALLQTQLAPSQSMYCKRSADDRPGSGIQTHPPVRAIAGPSMASGCVGNLHSFPVSMPN